MHNPALPPTVKNFYIIDIKSSTQLFYSELGHAERNHTTSIKVRAGTLLLQITRSRTILSQEYLRFVQEAYIARKHSGKTSSDT
jgi:hypothetical protein